MWLVSHVDASKHTSGRQVCTLLVICFVTHTHTHTHARTHTHTHTLPGVRDVYVSLEDEVVLVRASLPSAEVKRMLEETGKLVVFRGHGGISQEGGVGE